MHPEIKAWFNPANGAIARHALLGGIIDRWPALRAKRIPVLEDFWTDASPEIVDWSILMIRAGNDWLYLHHGEELARRVGFNHRGRTLTTIPTGLAPLLREIYDETSTEGVPCYYQSLHQFAREVLLWERVVLPLRSGAEDDQRYLLMVGKPVEDFQSIFRKVFDNSQQGLILMSPIRKETGLISDGWIMAANPGAERALALPDGSPRQLRRSRIFMQDNVWQHLMSQVEQEPTTATITDAGGATNLVISAEKIDDFIVLRLNYISANADVFMMD